MGGRSGKLPVATIADLNVTSSPPSTAIVFASENLPTPLTHVTPFALKSDGNAAGHLADDGALPLVRGAEVELRLADLHAELRERVARLMDELRRLHPRLRRDAPDAQARPAQLGLLLDAGDLRAELRCADRGGVATGATAQDGDVDFHLVSSRSVSAPKATAARPAGPLVRAIRAEVAAEAAGPIS